MAVVVVHISPERAASLVFGGVMAFDEFKFSISKFIFQTLNVVVDNCRDIKVCRVLDCDTITQVKEKCLTQIYVNYPASNLTVNPEELELGKCVDDSLTLEAPSKYASENVVCCK